MAKKKSLFNAGCSRTAISTPNHFSTAVPFGGQATQILNSLSPKRNCCTNRVDSVTDQALKGARPAGIYREARNADDFMSEVFVERTLSRLLIGTPGEARFDPLLVSGTIFCAFYGGTKRSEPEPTQRGVNVQ